MGCEQAIPLPPNVNIAKSDEFEWRADLKGTLSRSRFSDLNINNSCATRLQHAGWDRREVGSPGATPPVSQLRLRPLNFRLQNEPIELVPSGTPGECTFSDGFYDDMGETAPVETTEDSYTYVSPFAVYPVGSESPQLPSADEIANDAPFPHRFDLGGLEDGKNTSQNLNRSGPVRQAEVWGRREAARCGICAGWDRELVRTPCGHTFHCECIQDRCRCPLCGAIVEQSVCVLNNNL